MNNIELVLGGARSGKSRYAEQQLLALSQPVVYLATAHAGDGEMKQRIIHHQARRPASWSTREEPLQLAECLADIQQQQPQAAILVDCLTLWLTNCLLQDDGAVWPQQKNALLQQLEQIQQPLLLVSNEVGQGVVPMGQLSRQFVDESGWLHQDIAALAGQVTQVCAGLPLALKRDGQALYQPASLGQRS
ncbi:bifunctional adenosylcobinamide kinase/adenosylcobinamide-phosphate guanylyltransferase [Bacterioplanoides pacificum]|uniref:Bifunctional adenosylcobalamin biosynthesis protein n=1 Tax=Bacterioplanoides pacificum TaxID=1171596 RepID=A0ABV7VUU4_9GAMM